MKIEKNLHFVPKAEFLVCHWSIFSSLPPSLDAGKIHSGVLVHVTGISREIFSGSQTTLGTMAKTIGKYLKAGIRSIKRVQ
jgi:hypothetical protein